MLFAAEKLLIIQAELPTLEDLLSINQANAMSPSGGQLKIPLLTLDYIKTGDISELVLI